MGGGGGVGVDRQNGHSGYKHCLTFRALSQRVCCTLIKITQIFYKEPFANMKLVLEHREENITRGRFLRGRTCYKSVLKKLANFSSCNPFPSKLSAAKNN